MVFIENVLDVYFFHLVHEKRHVFDVLDDRFFLFVFGSFVDFVLPLVHTTPKTQRNVDLWKVTHEIVFNYVL